MNRNLALFRAGAKSLHPQAVAGCSAHGFDYALSCYGGPHPSAEGAVFVDVVDGAKWPGLDQTLQRHWNTISRYDFVWLPDDDLACDPAELGRMFAICRDLQLELAQPALTPDSYFSHVITLQHREFQLRFTNFVEIMAPVLSRDFLAKALPTIGGNLSGWGLDSLWPRMSRLGKVAIIDDTPVRHTRPLSNGDYPANREAGVPAVVEDWLVAAGAFIDVAGDHHLNLGGLLQNGDTIAIGSNELQLELFFAHLMRSLQNVSMSPLQYARYLSNHLTYWQAGTMAQPRYPRDMVRAVLDMTLANRGLKFPKSELKRAA